MSLKLKLKALAEQLPLPLAKAATRVPYAMRLGVPYVRSGLSLRRVSNMDASAYANWALSKLDVVVRRASQNSAFYRDRFAASGYQESEQLTWDSFERLPIFTKDDLRQVPAAARTSPASGMLAINTGGTSGSPLSFAIDRQAFAREWAHMHFIWRRAGYRPSQTKLTLRGRRWAGGSALRFNAVHNEWIVNASAPMQAVVESMSALPRGEICWVHGYPSLVAELALVLEEGYPSVLRNLRVGLHGVLLGSEYPARIYRDAIERVLSTKVVSWYGHSEMAILAWESALGVYQPIPSYGYTEIVADGPGGAGGRLVVTSYDNHVHPFIRYDTGDRVHSVDGPLGCPSFRISEGRVGEFIEDANGRRHSLTAIIFGRHHSAFEHIRHVQVQDLGAGNAKLFVVPMTKDSDPSLIEQGFDLSDLDIRWNLCLIDQPFRTGLGKTPLKVCTRTVDEYSGRRN